MGRVKHIDSIEKWNILSKAMQEKGYALWQMQYSWDTKQGFHAWFIHSKRSDVEVTTYNKDVEKLIVKYNNSV